MRSGSQGIAPASGILRRALRLSQCPLGKSAVTQHPGGLRDSHALHLGPRWTFPADSQKETPSLAQVLSSNRKVSRACFPISARVSPKILRLVTQPRLSHSQPLVCSRISG